MGHLFLNELEYSILSQNRDSTLLRLFKTVVLDNCTNIVSINRLREYSWELLHSVHWKDVLLVHREVYALASLLLIELLFKAECTSPLELIKMTDKAILLTSSTRYLDALNILVDNITNKHSNEIEESTKKYENFILNSHSPPRTSSSGSSTQHYPTTPSPDRTASSSSSSIKEHYQPDLVVFLTQYMECGEPVVLKGYRRLACYAWREELERFELFQQRCGLSYTLRQLNVYSKTYCIYLYTICLVCGYRTVPVETGSNYLSPEAGQRLMTMSEFIVNFILPSTFGTSDDEGNKELPPAKRRATDQSGPIADVYDQDQPNKNSPSEGTLNREVGYLAQHRLLDRLAILRRDIIIPDYCALLTEADEEYLLKTISSPEEGGAGARAGTDGGCDSSNDDVVINMWLGPCITVSPLHHDPYHNLLAQMHGRPFLHYPTELYDNYVFNISVCTISVRV